MRLFAILCLLAMGAWSVPVSAQSAQERALAKATLMALQTDSIRAGREFCGLILKSPNGGLVAGRASKGTWARCTSHWSDGDPEPTAGYHTHGKYLKNYDNEVPSLLDLYSAIEIELSGYVSTPGGRFWYIDHERGEVRLICGPKCLPWDPRHVEDPDDLIADRYTYEALKVRGTKW